MEAPAAITSEAVTESASSVRVVSAPSVTPSGTSVLRRLEGLLGEVLLLLLAALSFPLAVLLIGTPIALCVRLILEIARRL